MALENIKKVYNGGTVATTLASSINDVATSIVLTAGATYPTGSDGPFVIAIDRGLSTEEKILCSARTVNTLTVQQRGYDGSTAQAHTSPAAIILVADAHAIQQANWIVNGYSEAGTKGTTGHPLVGTSGLPAWQQLGTAGIADSAVTAAKIADAAVTAAKLEANFSQERIGGKWQSIGISCPVGTTYLTFSVENGDTDNFLTGSGTSITIPAGLAGVYAISATIFGPPGWGANGQYAPFLVCTGPTEFDTYEFIQLAAPGSNSATGMMGATVVALAAGDIVRMGVVSTGGTSIDVSGMLRLYRVSR